MLLIMKLFKNFAILYVGEFMNVTTGLMGVFSLCNFGCPYNLGFLGFMIVRLLCVNFATVSRVIFSVALVLLMNVCHGFLWSVV